jgi:HSP20 family molecular chaperone IbpA
MIFDQTWLAELLELQKKTVELTKGKNSVDEIQDLVMSLLNKWGISDLPWNGDFKSHDLFWAKDIFESKTDQHFNIDISEKKQHIQVRALIPGIENQSAISIKLSGNTICINGKSSCIANNEGSFDRKIQLPAEVTSAGASASYQENHLTIILPKIPADGEVIPLLDFSQTELNN